MALELAIFSNFQAFNFQETLNFLLNNRNDWGIWDSTTDRPSGYELIDTFQVIRSLTNVDVLDLFTPTDLDEMAQGILRYFHYNGFSPISKDLTQMSLMNSIANSFKQYDRIADFDLKGMYGLIQDAYYQNEVMNRYYFYSFTGTTEHLRSTPIEYYSSCSHSTSDQIGLRISHQSTFEALEALDLLYKLDDFEVLYNLSNILSTVLECQFLEDGYPNFGGFLPSNKDTARTASYQNKQVFMKYTYYAVKLLEFLCNHSEIDFSTLPIDFQALYTYVFKRIEESTTIQYYNSRITNNPTDLLEYTYYAYYILEAIDLNVFKPSKVTQFILTSIDYNDLKSVYYSYLISKQIGVDIEFESLSRV
jgi:hypothetical protein